MKSKYNIRHIHNSIVFICDNPEGDEVLRAVKDFDLANATPMQCFDFLRKLKNLFRKNGDA